MTPTSRARRLVAACLVWLLAVTAGCGRADADAPVEGIRIGVLVAKSGVYQSVGTDMQRAWDLYLDGRGGKLGGRKVTVVVGDEAGGGDAALAPIRKMIKEDRVVAVAGVVAADTVQSVLPDLAAAQVPLIGANGRPTKMDTSWTWHTSYISTEPGLAMGEYVARTAGGPVWVIGPDYQGGYDEIAGFVDSFRRAGGKLANPQGKPRWTPHPGTTNFQTYLAEILASDATAVYCFFAGGAAVNWVRQYTEFGLAGKVPLYAAGFLTEGTATLTAQGDTALGIRNSLNYSADLDNPANRAFVADYQATYQELPTTYAMAMWDAAQVLDRAIAGVDGPVTGEAINTAIAAIGQVDSPRGAWQFSATTRTPVQKWVLREVRTDGRALSNVRIQDLITLGG